jgi:hypothetical protein
MLRAEFNDPSAMMNVADWLRALDLGQYETAFHENSVTADILPNLTSEDLRDLGISRVGHRRRLLDAIAALRTATEPTGDQNSGGEVDPSAAGDRLQQSPSSMPERRHVSVMFLRPGRVYHAVVTSGSRRP